MKSNIPQYLRRDVKKDWTFADKHLPVIGQVLLDNAIKILEVQLASLDQDLEQATDLLLTVKGGEVAARVREKQYLKRFRDFTIRSRRISGVKTELQKIRDDNWCQWYLYCWSDDNFGLADWILVDLDMLRNSKLLDGIEELERANIDDRTWFISLTRSQLSDCIISRAKFEFSITNLVKRLHNEQGLDKYELCNMLHYPPALIERWLKLPLEHVPVYEPVLTVSPDGSGHLLRFPYDPDLIEDFKTILPPHARKWLKDKRAWWIDDIWLDGALQLAENHYRIEGCND